MGIVYLVQPAELVSTNRFKVGCSSKDNLDRVQKGYKKGTRYLHICECDKPFEVEKEIKYNFNKKFKLVAGIEYFEGNETDMKKCFIDTIEMFNKPKNEFNNITIIENQTIDIDNPVNKKYVCNKCNKVFGQKNDYTRHINRKISCNVQDNNLNENIQKINLKKNKCKYCNNILSRIDNLNRHIDTCKAKKRNELESFQLSSYLEEQNKKNNEIKELMETYKNQLKMSKELDELKKNINNLKMSLFNEN